VSNVLLTNPLRFALVGLACALAHNAIVLGLDRWHVHYAVSSALSFAIVVVLGYALHVRFTFEHDARGASFWRYAAGMAANYPLTLGLLFLMCDFASWPVAVAAPLATIALIAWNFCASRWAIARGGKPGTTQPIPEAL
jgi:putative flippase GtrA